MRSRKDVLFRPALPRGDPLLALKAVIFTTLISSAAHAGGFGIEAVVSEKRTGPVLEFKVSLQAIDRDGLRWGDEPWRGGASLRLRLEQSDGRGGTNRILGAAAPVTGDGSCRWLSRDEALSGQLRLNDRFPGADFSRPFAVYWHYSSDSCNKVPVDVEGVAKRD